MKFRKKPVVIDAWLFDGSGASFRRIVDEAVGKQITIASQDKYGQPVVTFTTRSGALAQFILAEDTIVIPTLEGDMEAGPGDWIIRDVKGELYPCKPDIFEATYEAV